MQMTNGPDSGNRDPGTGANASEPSTAPPPRAWVHHADGTRTAVPDDEIEGLDEFIAAWGRDVAEPEALQFEAWQQAYDEHPAGAGAPGYRIVFKTVRLLTFPPVQLVAANFRVVFGNGPTTTSEPRMVGALAERTPGTFFVPEWGRIMEDGQGNFGYSTLPAAGVHIDNHEDVTPDGNYVEVTYAVPEETPTSFAAQLAAGRAGVAPLLAELELRFGPRLMGPVLAEEVGTIFDDGHWNRRLGGRTIRTEAQASMQQLLGDFVAATFNEMSARRASLNDEQRRRTRIASQWYRRGQAEPDPTNSYIAFWLVLEALELDQNANIAPLRRAVADLLGIEPSAIAERLGRLYGTRSRRFTGNCTR